MAPTPSDPRKKPLPSLWRRMEDLDLPIPRMVIDENYVGEPPKIEVTMDNLNPTIKTMEYAVRGRLVIRATEIEKELQSVSLN